MKILDSLRGLVRLLGKDAAEPVGAPVKAVSQDAQIRDAFQAFRADDRFARCTDVVAFYQNIGFFKDRVPDDVIKDFFEARDHAPSLENWWDEAYLLGCDKTEVWTDDPEADVGSGGNVYREVLQEWAAISKGAFNPSGISEHWAGDEGPISIRFELDGRSVEIRPSYLDDWIDLDVLKQINTLIQNSGRQFDYVCIDNWCLVLCLTQTQMNSMRVDRKFPFALSN